MRSRLLPAVLAAVLTLTLAACSDDSDSGDGDTTTTEAADTTSTTEVEETTTTEAAPTTEVDSTETTAVDGEEPTTEEMEAALAGLLITPEELGGAFVEAEYEATGAGPCGVDVDAEYPADLLTGTAFSDEAAQLAMLQEIRVYDSEETALTAFEAGMEALSCGEDTVDPSIALGAPVDVSADVGVNAFAVPVTGDGVEGVLVVATYVDLISIYQFQGATGAAEAAGAADPTDIAAANMDYIVTNIG